MIWLQIHRRHLFCSVIIIFLKTAFSDGQIDVIYYVTARVIRIKLFWSRINVRKFDTRFSINLT